MRPRSKVGKKSLYLVTKLVSMSGSGYTYYVKKNPRRYPWQLQMLKYDPIVRRHVLFEERKMKG